MYVCICKAVTDSQIRQAVAQGATTMRELYYEHGVATNCCKCAKLTRAVLRDALEGQEQTQTLMAGGLP